MIFRFYDNLSHKFSGKKRVLSEPLRWAIDLFYRFGVFPFLLELFESVNKVVQSVFREHSTFHLAGQQTCLVCFEVGKPIA